MHSSGVFTPRYRGGVSHVRRPCLVRNCAREQGPPRERNALIATPQALAVARKSLNSVSPTTDTEYGFLLSQERRRTVRREIAELCVCNYHRRHCADCNRIAGLHPSPICGEGGPAKAGRVGVCPHSASSDRPHPASASLRPTLPTEGGGTRRATSPRKRKIACRQSRRGPSFETPAPSGLLRMRS